MRCVIAPDSYKGSMTSLRVAEIIELGIKQVFPAAIIDKVPVADGGEGTVEAFLAAVGGEKKLLSVTGPLGDKVTAFWGKLADGKTAVIEMAAASGLPLVPRHLRNPLTTTTYGTGELINAALNDGCTNLVIGIGGSATNDGGIGMAQALGIRFTDQDGHELGYGGGCLAELAAIDISQLNPLVKMANITIACDVDNPLCGPYGAATVFGPQKGADSTMIARLDQGLLHLGRIIREQLGPDILNIAGAGAAGGLGGGLVAFLKAELKSGIEIVIQQTGLPARIAGADLVITGEGKTDSQTARGKVPVGIAAVARQHGVPVICISGGLEGDYEQIYGQGISACFSIVPGPVSLESAMANGEVYLYQQVVNLFRAIQAVGAFKSNH